MSTLDWAHPITREWFIQRFVTATEPQESGWQHILANHPTLISAPTGSGKTLAAFLSCIDRLVRKALSGSLTNTCEVVYISPLKALSNDVQKNLELPLKEISDLAAARGLTMSEIRTAVRTGDTPAHERRDMLKHQPHILVTTPESLYILLTAEKSRALLKNIKTIIVDEIHAIVDDKRGAHLTISLERLERLCSVKPIRIGLSATQKPIEVIAEFLSGSGRPAPAIVNLGSKRQLDLAVEVPASPLSAIATNQMWDEAYDRLAKLIDQHRSTLIFVNTRRLAERLAHHLAQRLGEDKVTAHHGSLSRKLRHDAEKRLKTGGIKALVATASLELGIDIGFVDLVCQIGSTRSISTALQRIGRSGHWRGAVPRGRIFATTRDELVECAALVTAIRQGDLDHLTVPPEPLDILCQQIVAMCASEDWEEEALLAVIRQAYPYRNLSDQSFHSVVAMLSEGVSARRGRFGAYLHHDKINRVLRARRGSRLTAITGGGAIPDNALFTVVAEPEGTVVGTLDEDFAIESNRDDIMLLGNTSWRIRRVEGNAGRVVVENAQGAPPSVPFWRGEAPARTDELSAYVSQLRQTISDMLPSTSPDTLKTNNQEVAGAINWLKAESGLDQFAAQQLVEYIVQGRCVLGAVPTRKTIIAERFFDESGGMQLVIHAPFGGRINRAWGLALRKRFCVSFNFELQASATEDGLTIALAEQHSFPLADVFHFLNVGGVQAVLEQASLGSPIFSTRWRWVATRSLALRRYMGGKKVPPQIQRMRADDLLAAVFPQAAACQDNIHGDIDIPCHPLVDEVMKDVLTEAMDINGLKGVLHGIASGTIATLAVDTPTPSQFSHEILNANPYAFLDDAPLEERRARAVDMRRMLPESVLEEVGKLDEAAVARVGGEAWPDIRNPEELHDFLNTVIACPEALTLPGSMITSPQPATTPWAEYLKCLLPQGRAGIATSGHRRYWLSAERSHCFSQIYPDHVFEQQPAKLEVTPTTPEEALLRMIRGWMMHLGPVTTDYLAGFFGLQASSINSAMLKLESEGEALRGHFTDMTPGKEQWCNRRLLSRIHRLTVTTLRSQIEPVTNYQFLRWLFDWQHVHPGTQLSGERGLLEILSQLQGFEIPANAWEHQILARRIHRYDPQLLDKLCLTGDVGWGRLSPHPAFQESMGTQPLPEVIRRIVPTAASPISFFVRDQAGWMSAPPRGDSNVLDSGVLSHPARAVLEFLERRGASFFADLTRATGHLKAEVEGALWELVTAGLVTADHFDNLRALIDPKRRRGQGLSRAHRPRNSSGRWSLLHTDRSTDRSASVESACWMLLHRWGIVFRDLLAREGNAPGWRDLLPCLRRLEDRGEIRGGRFVEGFSGEQFALPMAVDSLRSLRHREPNRRIITISGADPLNLVGILIPGDRVPSVSSKSISFQDGAPVAQEIKSASFCLSPSGSPP